MSTTRWLSALLLVTLILSSAPVVSAAPAAAPAQQEPAAAGSTSYLLSVTPPKVSIPASTGAMQVAGHFNVEHARYYSMIESRLAAWQQQGAIAGFTAEPSAYAFVVRGVTPAVLGDLAAFGQLQPAGDLSAAAVDGLSSTYQESLQAAIAAATHPQMESAPAPAVSSVAPYTVQSAAAPKAGFSAEGVVKTGNISPFFHIQLNSSVIDGTVADGTYVTATLKTSAGVIKGVADDVSDGHVDLDLEDMYGNAVFVAATDILEVQLPGLITIPVVDLRASIDADEETATGVAPPNITNQNPALLPLLDFTIAEGRYITTTPSGIFDVATTDVSPGHTWELRFANSESQDTFVGGEIPILVLRGSYQNYFGRYGDDQPSYGYDPFDDTLISGAVIDANALLTVTLTRAGIPPIVNYTRSDATSAFRLHLVDQYENRVAILAGDTVQVTGGGVTLSATVPTFNVVSDPTTSTVSGTTNAVVLNNTLKLTQTLAIFPNTYRDDYQDGHPAYGKLTLADGGIFSVSNPFYPGADPLGTPEPLQWYPGNLGHLRYIDANGNVIFAGFLASTQAPLVSLRGEGYYMDDNAVAGLAGANGDGMVTLLDANNVVKARQIVHAGPHFETYLYDAYGNPLPIADGDSVVANFAGHTTTVKTPVLTITADPLSGIVTGTITGAPVTTKTPDAPESLVVYSAIGPQQNGINVLPDANGNFTADFGPLVFHPGDEASVKYVDANGNSVYAKWQVPFEKPILSLRGADEYRNENYVRIDLPYFPQQNTCTRTIAITVRAQDNTMRWQQVRAACTPSLELDLFDGLRNPIDLNAGDIVQATFEGKTATAVVPSFTSLSSDPRTSTVSGNTNAAVTTDTPDANQSLAVWPDNQRGRFKYVLVNDSTFAATNPYYKDGDPQNVPEYLSWAPGTQGYLRYKDAEGNSIYATFGALTDQPVLRIQKGSNWVDGIAPVSNGPVTVKVKSGPAVKGIGSVNTNLGGWFETQIFDGAGNPIQIAEGDVIEFTPPLTTVVVPALTAIVDVDNDRISGTGPANALLNVSLLDGPDGLPSMTVATDKDGNYALDLRGLVDIQTYMVGRLAYRNPDGQTIYIEQSAGTYLEGLLNTSRVWGQASAAGVPVQVTLQRAGAIIGMDTLVTEDEDGEFYAFLIDAAGRPVVEQPGDVVTAYFGSGGSRSLTLAPLQVSVDLATNTVSGAGPAASLLGVEVYYSLPENGYARTTVLTDGTGHWSFDLTAWMVLIEAGDVTDLTYTSNGTDYTWLGAVAPIFWVRSSEEIGVDFVGDISVINNLVTGYAGRFEPVMVTIKRNGGVLAFLTVEADYWGYYEAYLYDRNGLDAEIMPGDIVEVQSVSGPPVSVTVPVMTAVVDDEARMITGVGPANADMGLYYDNRMNKTVHTGPDGTFATTIPNITVAQLGSDNVLLTYKEPQGNWIRAQTGDPAVEPAHLDVRWVPNYVDPMHLSTYLAHAVSGSAGAALTQVQVSLSRGGSVIAMGAVMSDQYGQFTAELRDLGGQPVDILGGDLIEMAAAEVTRSLVVPEMSVQTNLESHTLYGTGPANATLLMWGPHCGDHHEAADFEDYVVDPSGNWVLPCSGLNHEDAGWIAVQDLQGNQTYLYWSVPIVKVRLNGNDVHGTLVPEAEASVQLWRLNAKVAETVVTANEANGTFDAELWGSGGTPFIILPDDIVVVAYGNQSITVPVVSLSSSVDNAADAVTGVGPARQVLGVSAQSSGLAARYPEIAWVDRWVTTADDGSYVADFAGVRDIQGGDSVEVSYTNVDGNIVYLYHAASLVRINLGSDIVDGYATPNSLASIVLKRGGDTIGSTKAPTAMDGAFSAYFLDSDGNVIDLIAGDVVEVTASPTVASSAVGLTAVVDPALDRISGSAPAGAAVMVVAYTCTNFCFSHPATAIAGADGSYALNLAGIFDLDLTSYAYVQVIDGAGNMTSFTSAPSAVPQLAAVEGRLQAAGAIVLTSGFGTGNPGNLTPPMALNAVGPGKLTFVANGGTLVVTAPDGTIMRSEFGYLSVANPLTGRWLVQVQVPDGPIFSNGTQYAMAAGQGLYTVYMPIVKQQTKK